MDRILGIGSRIAHPEHGKGVITNVSPNMYWVTFIDKGLETIEQVQVVKDAGCNLGQGYYFSRAVPDYLAAMLLAQEREDEVKRATA